jgi:hypothetical protein
LAELVAHFTVHEPRGEFVVTVAGKERGQRPIRIEELKQEEE